MSSPPEPVLFLDRNLGTRVVPEALRILGCDVRVADDLFPQDTADEVWLAEVGANGWLVVTLDERIRYRRVELGAVCAHGVGMFVVAAWKGRTHAETAEVLKRARSALLRVARQQPRPFIAKVYRDGAVRVWLNAAALERAVGS